MIEQWFNLLAGGQQQPQSFDGLVFPTDHLFSKATIDVYWLHTTHQEGHPSGYTLLSAAGRCLCRILPLAARSECVSYRIGAILLFSFAMAASFYRMRVTFGFQTAFFSVLAVLCLPRVFAHAQITACDSMLMSGWILTWAFFETGLKNIKGAMLWGIMLGIGLSAKFSGWGIPAPFIAFALLCCAVRIRVPGIGRLLAIGIPMGIVTFCILNPNVWYNPFDGLVKFFSLYLLDQKEHFTVTTMFLHHKYSFAVPLPWYNTLVWAGITVPIGILALFLLTVGSESGRIYQLYMEKNKQVSNKPEGMNSHRRIALLFLCFCALMVVRTLPGTPVHDGIRQFVGCFPFLGFLAGIAAGQLWLRGSWSAEHNAEPALVENDNIELKKSKSERIKSNNIRCLLVRSLITLVFASSVFNLYWYAPHWLSFYNIAIGGLKGATAAGMETTYYWDGMGQEVFDWLNEHTDYDGSQTGQSGYVQFFSMSSDLLYLYYQWKLLGPAKVAGEDYSPPGVPRWYVFQNRQGVLCPVDYPQLQGVKPVYEYFIRKGGIGPWDLGHTPLISIYNANDAPELKDYDGVTNPAIWKPGMKTVKPSYKKP